MASPDSRDSVEAVADYSAVSMRSQSLIKIPMRLRGSPTAASRAGVIDHHKSL